MTKRKKIFDSNLLSLFGKSSEGLDKRIWVPPGSRESELIAKDVWIIEESSGTTTAVPSSNCYKRVTLDELPTRERVNIVFNACDVTLLEISVPPLSLGRLQRALPSLVEDFLLQDPTSCILTIGPKLPNTDRYLVGVIDRLWFEKIIEIFSSREVSVAAAWPAQLLVPLSPTGSLLCLKDSLIFRSGPFSGIGIHVSIDSPESCTESLASLLPILKPQAIQPSSADTKVANTHMKRTIKVFIEKSSIWEQHVQWLSKQPELEVITENISSQLWHGVQSCSLNLLKNQFFKDSSEWIKRIEWHNFRVPIYFLLSTVLIYLVSINLHWYELIEEQKKLTEAMISTLSSTFPKTTVVVDPLLQMRRGLADLRSQSGEFSLDDFIPLVAHFSEFWTQKSISNQFLLYKITYHDSRLNIYFDPSKNIPVKDRPELIREARRLGLMVEFSENEEPMMLSVSRLN